MYNIVYSSVDEVGPPTTIENIPAVDDNDQDSDEEPSVLGTLSDDQLARRPSFKYDIKYLASSHWLILVWMNHLMN